MADDPNSAFDAPGMSQPAQPAANPFDAPGMFVQPKGNPFDAPGMFEEPKPPTFMQRVGAGAERVAQRVGDVAEAGAQKVGDVAQAGAEAFGDQPLGLEDILSPESYRWYTQHVTPGAAPDVLYRGVAALGDLAARGSSAAFAAGQKAVSELGNAISPGLGNSLAGMPEAFMGETGMGALGHAQEGVMAGVDQLRAGRNAGRGASAVNPDEEAIPEPPENQPAASPAAPPSEKEPLQTLENISQGKPANAPPPPTQAPTSPKQPLPQTPEQAALTELEEAEQEPVQPPPAQAAPQAQAAAQAPSPGIAAGMKGMGSAISENLRNTLWDKFQKGDLTEAGAPSRLLTMANNYRDSIKDRPSFDRFLDDYANGRLPPAGTAPQQMYGLEPVTNAQGQWIGERRVDLPESTPVSEAPEPTPQQPPEKAGPDGTFAMLRPDQLKTNPDLFQYKEADERGVTGALLGTNRWEPKLANPITAWRDEDGDLWVVNGHQRHDLATRAEAAGQQDVQIPTRIFDARDGYSPEYMRALGAYQNIAEGSGTALDAARILRTPPADLGDLKLPELPPRSALVQQARGLAKLSDQPFGMVSNGIVPPEQGAIVGEMIAEPQEQLAAMDAIAKAKPANANQARFMVQDIRNSGFLQGAQTTLFGDEQLSQSLLPQRAQILDYATRLLRRNKSLFKAAVEGEETLTGAGNKLARSANIEGQTANARLLETLQRDATTKGPLSDALSAAARDLAAGKPVSAVAARFLSDARKIESRGPREGVEASGVSGGAGPEKPDEAGTIENENQDNMFAGRTRRPVPGQTDMFGPEAQARPTAEPEYTIRNDPRQQQLFGPGQEAVQAQAARDQAGRGALMPNAPQKAANEGLFAPRETPQPELLPAAREPPAGSLGRNFSEFEERTGLPPDEAAAQYVFGKGLATGNEYLTAWSPRTNRVVMAHTSDMQGKVFLPEDFKDAINDPNNSLVFHHNHPMSTSLSLPDLGMASKPGVSYVVAHARDGNTYAAALRPGVSRWAVEKAYEQAVAKWDARYQQMAKMNPDLADRVMSDIVMRELHKRGLINYVTTAEPSEDAINAGLRNAATAIRPDQRVEAVSQLAREAAAGRERENAGAFGATAHTGPNENGLALAETTRDRRQRELGRLATDKMWEALGDKSGFRAIPQYIKAALSPTSLKGAEAMEHALRFHGAASARDYDQVVKALESVRAVLDSASKEDQIEFTDRMERGIPQATPELQQVADTLRKVIDEWTKKIQSQGRGYLAGAVDNYMGHIYGNYNEWKAGLAPEERDVDVLKRAINAGMSKSPLKGSANFLKKRVFPTQKDAINAGLIPITYNPVDLQLMKIREMQKFYEGTRLADTMVKDSMAVYVPVSMYREAEAQGFRRLDDRAFNPKVNHPEVGGLTEHGSYWAPEPMARIFNNYMSRGLVGNPVYDVMRIAGNVLNQAQLGLSGFHALFIANDTAASDLALAVQSAVRGEFGRAGLRAGRAVIPLASVVRTVRAGSKTLGAWYDPEGADALWKQTAEDAMIGGARSKMDTFYRDSASGAFFKSFADLKNPKGALYQMRQMWNDAPGWAQRAQVPFKIIARALDTINEPLMGYLVPRAKLGAFAQLAQDWQRRNPTASPFERARAMTQFWDSIENRMGQMTYDNVMWHKTSKDIAFIGLRSVGWNLGTIRELGGGVLDTARALNDIAHWRTPKGTTRMAYLVAMPIQTAILGTIVTYLLTGHGPTSSLDYFYPPTGTRDKNGSPERLSLPSYIKDVVAYSKDPLGTMMNKTSPLIELGKEMYENTDYYGASIYDPERDHPVMAGSSLPAEITNGFAAYSQFLLNEAAPFSLHAMARLANQGADPATIGLSFWGVQPAPASVVNPHREQEWEHRQNMIKYRRRLKEPGRFHPFTQ